VSTRSNIYVNFFRRIVFRWVVGGICFRTSPYPWEPSLSLCLQVWWWYLLAGWDVSKLEFLFWSSCHVFYVVTVSLHFYLAFAAPDEGEFCLTEILGNKITLLSFPISLAIGFLFYSILLILIYTKIRLHLAAVCPAGPCIELPDFFRCGVPPTPPPQKWNFHLTDQIADFLRYKHLLW